MAVYVDPMGEWGKSATWCWSESCHLFADTEDELHSFAKELGLKRSWFQRGSLPHYDLVLNKRKLAVRLGAVEVNHEFVGERVRAYRKARAAADDAPAGEGEGAT